MPKISELPAVSSLDEGSLVAVVQGGTTSKIALSVATGRGPTASETAGGVTIEDASFQPGDCRRYGAAGDGTTDDTDAVQDALDSGHTVTGGEGATYLVGPLTQSTAYQVVNFSGCTIKRKASSAHAPMLTLGGTGARVVGGVWDGNKAAQSPTGDEPYEHCAVSITADYGVVDGIVAHDHEGMGIKGVNCSYTGIRNNVCTNCELYGIYVEGITAHEYGNEISGNLVTCSGLDAASGIYLTGSNSPYTYKQYNWRVTGNTCIGSTSTPTGIGITTVAVDGVIAANVTSGFTMGISADIATRTVIASNRCSAMAGATGYGIELNGGYCTVSDNVVQGGIYGICISGLSTTQPHIAITGNVIDDSSSRAIFVQAGSQPANYLNINGNTIVFTGSGTNRSGVYLAGDVKYSIVSANIITGPGSGISGGRAVYLDTVASYVSIIANRIHGWERACGVYSAAATTPDYIVFRDNDCTYDVTEPLLNFEGSATAGDGSSAHWNSVTTGSQTTVGGAGGATALPATPKGYLRMYVGQVAYVVPYYNAS